MGGFSNGRYPLSTMVKLGPKHYLPAGTAARWQWMVRQALAKYAVLLVISPGWNGYRPYDEQVTLRAELGIWAAVPGYSSHGLIYQGRQVAAIDVFNWRDLAPGNETLAWSRFKALCRLAGFTVDFVSPQELWHIGDFNDIWVIPAFTQEDDMALSTEDKKWMRETIGWERKSAVNGLGFGDMVRVTFDSIRYGKKGVRTHGEGMNDILTRLGALQIQVDGQRAAIEALAKAQGADPAAILKAVTDGVNKAMDKLEVTLSVDAG